nr:glycoside hydrolase family 3 protein [Clostridia bacterium]
MTRNWKKLFSLLLAMVMVLTSLTALAEVRTIETDPEEVVGTVSGYLDAEGHFYSDYMTKEEALAAGNRVHLQMVEEGQVLLKNENNALPLSADERDVTFLGLGSVDFVRSGGGSGAASGTSYKMNWFEGFESQGFSINPKTRTLYENLFAVLGGANDANDSGKLLEPDMSYYSKSVVSSFAAYDDAAIVFITRFGRENIDLQTNSVEGHSNPDDHYLQLDDNELALIKMAKANFPKVVVVINSSNIMQIAELNAPKDTEYGVDAILWVGGVGDQGTKAAAEILTGAVNPSGHTVDIWPADFKADPTWTNAGDMTQNKDENGERMTSWMYYPDGSDTVFSSVEYREGIYYGYRYYETKAADMDAAAAGTGEAWYDEAVNFPFGHGLSYTTFEWELVGASQTAITAPNQNIAVEVKVTNTGDVAGKEVVQLYATTPYYNGGIEKAHVVLVGFAKTDMLQPGESDTVYVEFTAQDMASFDWNDANNNGFTGYELEHGDYIISARYDSHNEALSVTFNVAEDILCKTDLVTGAEIKPVFVDDFETTRESLLNNMISRANGLEQPKAQTAEERVLEDWEAAMLDGQETYYPYNDEEGQPWYVSEVPANWTQGAETDVTLADLAGTVYTEATIDEAGVATAATDEVSLMWESYMNSLTWLELEQLVLGGEGGSDGPVKFGGTCWQSTPIAAATWNQELVREQGELYGNQALLNGTVAWRGPGNNIHRTPFNGRNFEYYSEDPCMTAIMSTIVVDAVQSKGIGCYTKHFFANVQEHNRADFGGVMTFATEQVFREIYMRSYEWTVKYGHSTGMMTSFNRIGYTVNSNNWAVHETLLRGEWGFKASTINDMWAKDFVSVDLMMRAGDDVLMGSDSSHKNYLTRGTWDATARDGKGMVAVPTEDGDGTFLSPTQYYAVRKSAQRLLYSFVNSNKYKNFASDYELTATVYYGVAGAANIVCEETSDFSVTLAEGQTLPAGFELSGFVVKYDHPVIGTEEYESNGSKSTRKVYGDYPAMGTYEMLVNMECDGYISVKNVKLTINVVSPFQVNDELMMGVNGEYPVIKLTKDAAVDVTIDSIPYAYQAFVNGSQVTNYYAKQGKLYLRDEEKTHADGTTIPYAEAEELYEVHYKLEGTLPAGLTAEEIIGVEYGLRTRKAIDVVQGLKLSGIPTEAGEYVVTVVAEIPTCSVMAGIWLSPSAVVTVTQSFVIVVE